MRTIPLLLLASLSLCSPVLTLAAEATAAVAANFSAPAEALASAFAASSGHQIQISAASTGKLYAQIKNGAPFDLLLSADQKTPQQLIDDGLADQPSRFTYALGTLVLWSADRQLLGDGAAVLKAGQFNHLAIANPELAPYGAAAMATLRSLGLAERLNPKLVMGESIAQTYQFAASGNAQLGFVAYSQVLKDGRLGSGSAWPVPTALYPPLAQDALLLKRGAGNDAARGFLEYLRTAPALALIAAYGYRQPEAP